MSSNFVQTQLTGDEGAVKAVAIYKEVLAGKRKRFPDGFFKGVAGLENAGEITGYLIESILKIPSDKIPQKVSQRTFKDNKLEGMLLNVFNGSPYLAIKNAYPREFKEWEFSQQGMWQGEEGLKLAKEAAKWLIEEKEKMPFHEIPQKVSQRTFKDNGLEGMLTQAFNGSPYLAIENAYPGRFKKWEFTQQRMWQGEEGLKLAKEATKWLIEEKEKIPFHKIPQKVSQRTFRDNGLSGMLAVIFNSSPYRAVDNAYPGRFKKWEFTQQRMWQGEEGLKLAIKATKWMIKEKKRIPFHKIPQKVTAKMFEDNNLSGMLVTIFNNSPYRAVDNAYPGKFKEWDFTQQGMWQGEEGLKLAIKATKWMIEEIEKIPLREIPQKVSKRTFKDNGLSGMLSHVFNDSPYRAVDNAYPGEFKEWQFRHHREMWQGEEGLKLAKKATKWVIEEIEKVPFHEIPQKVSQRTFKDNGLLGMLKRAFNDSPYHAVDNAYPGEFKEWEFTQQGMWKGEEGLKLAKKATKWMIEEIEKIPPHEIPQKVTAKTFQDNNLSGMLATIFNSSPYRAVVNAYPEEFKEWDFPRQGMWQGEEGLKLAIKATKWMIEEIEKIPFHKIPQKVTAKMFADNGLVGMLSHGFNNSPYLAIDKAYPGKFNKEDFQSEHDKKRIYNLKIGVKTQKAFVEYISNYCKNHNLRFKYEEPAGSGRIEFWCEGNKVTVIDITRATTKSAIINKWRKRNYHEDPRIDEVWIVVNSDAFSIREYAEFNRNCPNNMRVFHILELFDELGEQPESELRLKLEAYSICRLHKKDYVRRIYRRALEEGKEHIAEEDVQTFITDFQD